MNESTSIHFQLNVHVKEVLDEHCERGTRNAFIERCLFLDEAFAKRARRHGIFGPTRRNPPGNPEFGKGYQGRWANRSESEATFHELEDA